MQPRHFLDIDALDRETLRAILDEAHAMKAMGRSRLPDTVKVRPGAVLAMIFEQPSTRTRVSFEVAMRELGGASIMLSSGDMQLGRGETIADTARVLSRYVDAIMLRTGPHETLLELAEHATRAGDQRADRSLPSLSGHGRRHDLRGEEGRHQRRDGRLARRRQQRRHLLGARRRALRLQAQARLPEEVPARAGAARLGGGRRRAGRGRSRSSSGGSRAPIAW